MKRAVTILIYVFSLLAGPVSIFGTISIKTSWLPDYYGDKIPKYGFSVNNMYSSKVSSCPNYIGLYSQEDIDMFSDNYSGCIDLPGDLEIFDFFGNITNLDGLSGINSIAGLLFIGYTDNLTNLNGLENLSSLGGGLILDNNSVLTSIAALSNLSGNVPTVYIGGNNMLPNLVGLEGIQEIPDNLNIQDNAGLQNLNGLNSLTSIGGWVFINNNNSLLSLSGLDGLQEILGDLSIQFNFNLQNLIGLHNLASVGGGLFISNNNSLLSFSGLDGLQEISGSFTINNNINLLNLGGLNNLSSIGSNLFISSNISLTDLSALSNVSGTVSSVSISGNNITNLSGLEGLESILGNLSISNNLNLLSMSGLEGLSTIQGNLSIINSPNLNDISALNNVSGSISSIRILGTSISSLNALSGITHISGILDLSSISNLTSLSGLENLTSISGILRIDNIMSLTNISALSNLSGSIASISIFNNSNLSSLEGLDNISGITSSLSITNNSMLSTCDILSVCNYLLNPPVNVNISNNSTGCNSTAEVIEKCIGIGCTNIISPQNGGVFIATNATLFWSEAFGAIGYKLKIGTTPGGDQLLELTDLGNVIEYQPVTGLPYDTEIYVQVFPYNSNDELNNCQEISFTTIPEVLPCATLLSPANGSNVSLASIGSSVLTFTWQSLVPGISYGFYLGLSPEEAIKIATVAGTSMPVTQGMFDTLFVEKQTYYWFVVPLESSPDLTECQQSARSFTINCYQFAYNHSQFISTDGDTEIQMSSMSPFRLDDITVSIDIYESIFSPQPFLSLESFPGVHIPELNYLKGIPGMPTGGKLRRTCADGTLITLSGLFPSSNLNYCSNCIPYQGPEGPPVNFPRCVLVNQDQTINLTMKSAFYLPGNYDFDGDFPNNSTGVPTHGKELFFNFSPMETGEYYIQVNEVSNSSFISYLFKEDDGETGCDPAGWTGLSRVNGPMTFNIGALEVGKTYKFVMAAEDTVSTRHSFIILRSDDLQCPDDLETCFSSEAFELQGEGTFTGPGVSGGVFNPSEAGVGNHEIVYTVNEQSCTFIITVSAGPEVTCPSDQSFCTNDAAFKITGGFPAGGTYEGPGVTDGDFDPAMAVPGVYVITYTFTDEQNCTNSCSFTYSVFEPATIVCPEDIEACITSIAQIPLSVDGYPNGVFSGPGVVNSGGGFFFNPSMAALGENTISFEALDENGCIVGCSFVAFVVDGIALTGLPDLQFCSNSQASYPLEIEGYSNQVFDGPGVQLIDFQYFFNPSSVSPGEYSISFEAFDSDGCAVSGTFIIEVVEPQAISCPDGFEVHLSDGLIELSISGYPTGVFAGEGVILNSGTYFFDPSFAGGGTQVISFSALDANGCLVSCSFEIYVNNEVLIDCPENAEYCAGDNNSYLLFLEDYPSGQFSGPGVSLLGGLFFFSPSAASVGDHNIEFSAEVNGILYLCSFTMLVISEIPITCPDDLEFFSNDNTLYPLSIDGFPDGVFEGPGVVFVSGTYFFNPELAGVSDHVISFTANDNDCLFTCQFLISVIAPGTCPEISAHFSGDQEVCPGESVFLTVEITGGISPYQIQIEAPNGTLLTQEAPIDGIVQVELESPMSGTYSILGISDAEQCDGTTSGNATVSSYDTTSPVAVCLNIFVSPDEEGNYFFNAEAIDGGSDDNCGIQLLEIDQDWILCNEALPTIVTLTVTDVAGNTASCTALVTPEGDSDCDGVGDACDLCPGGDDSVDNNGDGLPDCYYYPGANYLPASWTCSNNPNNEKVRICHNGNTLCVSENAIPAFIAIGAFIGPCNNAGCEETGESALTTTPSGIPNIQFEKDGFTAYPNPSSGALIVVVDDELENGIFNIIDMHGTIKLTVAIVPGEQRLRLDVHQFAAGTYILRLQTDNAISSKKLIIIKH